MKPIFCFFLIGSMLGACGQAGLKPETGFLREADVRSPSYPQLEAQLDRSGNLVLTNRIYSSWNGKRLQGNENLSVIAVD